MKKMILDFDAELCCSCGACAVACMDQNDYDPKTGNAPFRTIFEMQHKDEKPVFRSLHALFTGSLHHRLPGRLSEKGPGNRSYHI